MKITNDIDTIKKVLDGILELIYTVNEYQSGYIHTATELECVLSGEPSDELIRKRQTEFQNGWTYTIGKNWIRVIHNGEVYAFICINKNSKKKWMKVGDILRPASYAQPSLNFNRGNVLMGASTWKRYITKKGII